MPALQPGFVPAPKARNPIVGDGPVCLVADERVAADGEDDQVPAGHQPSRRRGTARAASASSTAAGLANRVHRIMVAMTNGL